MGILYVVATPIGNLSDITSRAIDTLKEVDYILCEDTRTSLKLLNHFDIKQKLVSYHKFNENERVDSILSDLKNGINIAVISDAGTPCINDPGEVIVRGTPCINDPGEVIVRACRNNNVPVFGIGGISACITALSISGLDTSSFTFYGFFPREKKDQNKLIEEIKSSKVNTYIFYESPKRIIKTLEVLNANFLNLKISVSKELTKLHEKNYYGNISDVLEMIKNDDKSSVGEYTFVIEKDSFVKEEVSCSIEAMLVDIVVKNNCTLKEAVDILNKENSSLSKKEIYNASLNLKDMFNK